MGKLKKLVGAAGVVAGAAYLSKSENRRKLKEQLDKALKKLSPSYVKELGKPSDIDDAKMVDEGAMTSVQYYNRIADKKSRSE